ncbi:MAG: hypothetical protein F4Z05_06005 [Chloroflexi bacterium]|nr:hypothetical protein [Chloroflexota bacterium]
MDRTLNPVKRGSKRRRARNAKAWQLYSPDGDTCRFCPHGAADHLTSSGQPHFYRPATEAERRNLLEKLYRHDLPDGDAVLVKRVTVANRAELLTAFCKTCAAEKGTTQVLCYVRTLAKGEVVGLATRDQ